MISFPTAHIVYLLIVWTCMLDQYFYSVRSTNPVSISTKNENKIVGRSQNGVDTFLGIKYGSVISRFSRSHVNEDFNMYSNTTFNATQFGPQCMQPRFLSTPAVPMSEDCLHLNIWRPSNVTFSSLLPVMVWIPGGGFVAGSGSSPLYNATSLALRGNVIVVTINYRLSVFGFLVTNEEDGYGGMHGIDDQINALQWIQNYIISFGGDAQQVTIFGESAGGVSTCLLSVSPRAVGLFQRAIIQSGQCISERLGPRSREEGVEAAQSFFQAANATSLYELANWTAEDILAVGSDPTGVTRFYPSLDGMVMPTHPKERYQNSNFINPVDMVIGSNSYDDVMLLFVPPQAYLSQAEEFESYIVNLFGADAAGDVLRSYNATERHDGNNVPTLAEFHSDFFFLCSSRELASLAASNMDDGKVYFYHFAHLTQNDPAVANALFAVANLSSEVYSGWASHTAEIPFMFGNLDQTFMGQAQFAPPNEGDLQLRDEMMDRWTNFAILGVPSTKDERGVEWAAVPKSLNGYDTSGIVEHVPSLILQDGGSVMDFLEEKVEQCSSIPGVKVNMVGQEEVELVDNVESRATTSSGHVMLGLQHVRRVVNLAVAILVLG